MFHPNLRYRTLLGTSVIDQYSVIKLLFVSPVDSLKLITEIKIRYKNS